MGAMSLWDGKLRAVSTGSSGGASAESDSLHVVHLNKKKLSSDTADSAANTAEINAQIVSLSAAGGGVLIIDGMWPVDEIILKDLVILSVPGVPEHALRYTQSDHGFIATANTVDAVIKTNSGETIVGAGQIGLYLDGSSAPNTAVAIHTYNAPRFTNHYLTTQWFSAPSVIVHEQGTMYQLLEPMIVNCSSGNRTHTGIQPLIWIKENAHDAVIDGGEIAGSLLTELTPTSDESRLTRNEWIDDTLTAGTATTVTLTNTPSESVEGWLIKVSTANGSEFWREVTSQATNVLTLSAGLLTTPASGDTVRIYPTLVVGIKVDGANCNIRGRTLVEFCDINFWVSGLDCVMDNVRADFSTGPQVVIDSLQSDINVHCLNGSMAADSEFDQVIFLLEGSGRLSLLSSSATAYTKRPRHAINYTLTGSGTQNREIRVIGANGLRSTRILCRSYFPPIIHDDPRGSGFVPVTITGTTLDITGLSRINISASSPTTINTLTGGYDGQEVIVRVGGTNNMITVQYGATCFVPNYEAHQLETLNEYRIRIYNGVGYWIV